MESYVATYERFETPSKKEAGALLGSDNLVGDNYDIRIELKDGIHTAWLVNRFGKTIGYFDSAFSRKIGVWRASGLKITCLLTYVAFTETPEPGRYWGEMAVIAYNPAYEDDFKKFIDNVSYKLQNNIRPKIDLGQEAVDHIIATEGAWLPEQNLPQPAPEKGTAILKKRRSVTDHLVEQARERNKGCYVLSCLLIIVFFALIILCIGTCSGTLDISLY